MQNEAWGREPEGLILHHARVWGLDPASSHDGGFLSFYGFFYISFSSIAQLHRYLTFLQVGSRSHMYARVSPWVLTFLHECSHSNKTAQVPKSIYEFPILPGTYPVLPGIIWYRSGYWRQLHWLRIMYFWKCY
jgi:hypothetical protein